MRYVLAAGRVLSEGEFIALGAVLDLSDDEAARYRLGGCTLTPVSEPEREDSAEADGADVSEQPPAPAPRPTRARRTRGK